jgi:hypothetical protein
MEVFPFMFYHPLERVNPCFEDRYTGFLSDVVENVSDRAFQVLLVRDVVFGEFSLDTTKEEVTWCDVPIVNRVRYPLDRFARRHSVDQFALCGPALSRWMYKPLSDFLRECNAIPSNKLDTTVSQKNAKLSVLPFRTSTKL